jgi:formate hydrogenlyase transcriptional activator
MEQEIRPEMNFEQVIEKSAALQRVLKEVETIIPTDSTALIYGDTGTGKELIARVHYLWNPANDPFVGLGVRNMQPHRLFTLTMRPPTKYSRT